MREIIEDTKNWRQNDETIALATVVKTWGSAPRKVGAKMAVTGSGKMAGSVSGGCVEGAVVEAGIQSIGAKSAELIHFGVADETAWEVGLACGGMIDVFVEPFQPTIQQKVTGWVENEQGGAVTTVIAGDGALLGQKLLLLPDETLEGELDSSIREEVALATRAAFKSRKPARVTLADGQTEIFVDVIMPSPTLIIVGGVHIAIALIKIAETLGFRPIVIDPRRSFGSADRFPDIDLRQLWPRKAFLDITINQATAVALLTHDPKIDDQALEFVLPSKAFYIGALGSKKTAAKRRQRLLDAGYDDALIDRIYGPIGLRINAQTPEEIALAVMGEIISAYRA